MKTVYKTFVHRAPPPRRDRQYFGRNFEKFRKLLITFGTNHPESQCDWKIVKYSINTCTTLRNDDVIVTSLKFRFPCPEKGTDSYFCHNFDIFKYIVVMCCKEYHEGNAKLLTQRKSASPNQRRYFTLRIRQWPCRVYCKAQKVITDNCNWTKPA